MNTEDLLKTTFPAELIDILLHAYREIESNFSIRKWKASELDAGHFVEAARRIIEQVLFSTYTPIGKSLPDFRDVELKRYEQAIGDESFRVLIPRVLKSIYNIRNKRGVGHLGKISPNEMDATLILYSVKWVLAEFVRLSSEGTRDVAESQKAVDAIVERRLDLIWKDGSRVRILGKNLKAWQQILILLYDQNYQAEEALREIVEYKNSSDFRKILKKLHSEKLIDYRQGQSLVITSFGINTAEEMIIKIKGMR